MKSLEKLCLEKNQRAEIDQLPNYMPKNMCVDLAVFMVFLSRKKPPKKHLCLLHDGG
jgi:hypothetical protein